MILIFQIFLKIKSLTHETLCKWVLLIFKHVIWIIDIKISLFVLLNRFLNMKCEIKNIFN